MKKNTRVNLFRFLSALSFSLLLLAASAQTNSADVNALGLLFTTFGLVSTRDPCLPTPLSVLECSSGNTPRITALNFGGAGLLAKSLLPDFSAMNALEKIDLSGNFLVQDFPDFLANFPRLKVLNLANNFFSGTIPVSFLTAEIKATLEGTSPLEFTLTGTQLNNLCVSDEDLCEAPRTETQRSSDQELSDARISLSDNQAQRSLDSADFFGKIGR